MGKRKRRRKRKPPGIGGAGAREGLSRQSAEALRAALEKPLPAAHEPLPADVADATTRTSGQLAYEAFMKALETGAGNPGFRQYADRSPASWAAQDLLHGPPADVGVLAGIVAAHVPGSGDRFCLTAARAVWLMGGHEKKVMEAAEKAVSDRRRSIDALRERLDHPQPPLYDDRPGVTLADALREEALRVTAATVRSGPSLYQEGYRAACAAYAERLERRATDLEAGDDNLVRRWPIHSPPPADTASRRPAGQDLEAWEKLRDYVPADLNQQRRYWRRRVAEALTGVGMPGNTARRLAGPLLDRLPWPADIDGLSSRLAAAEAEYRELDQRRVRFTRQEKTWRAALAKEFRQQARTYSSQGAARDGQFAIAYDAASSRIAGLLDERARHIQSPYSG